MPGIHPGKRASSPVVPANRSPAPSAIPSTPSRASMPSPTSPGPGAAPSPSATSRHLVRHPPFRPASPRLSPRRPRPPPPARPRGLNLVQGRRPAPATPGWGRSKAGDRRHSRVRTILCELHERCTSRQTQQDATACGAPAGRHHWERLGGFSRVGAADSSWEVVVAIWVWILIVAAVVAAVAVIAMLTARAGWRIAGSSHAVLSGEPQNGGIGGPRGASLPGKGRMPDGLPVSLSRQGRPL
jgi:hypothetical protein